MSVAAFCAAATPAETSRPNAPNTLDTATAAQLIMFVKPVFACSWAWTCAAASFAAFCIISIFSFAWLFITSLKSCPCLTPALSTPVTS